MDPETALIASQAQKVGGQLQIVQRRAIRVGGVLFLAAVAGGAGWYFWRRAKIQKWINRLSETDVQTAAYFASIFGPQTLVAKIKGTLWEAVKSLPIANLINKGYEWIAGGSDNYRAAEVGVDMSNDWALVLEAYNGLTAGHNLIQDLQKKLSQDEFSALMKRLEDKKTRITNANENLDDIRNKYIALIYDKLRNAPVGKIVTVRNTGGSDFSQTRLYAYEAKTYGYSWPAQTKDTWSKGQKLGSPTMRFVKIDPSKVLMEIATSKGPRWFRPESTSHKP